MNQPMRRILLFSVFGCVVSVVICPSHLCADDLESVVTRRKPLEESLGQVITVKADQLPLADLAKQIGTDTGVEIRFDAKALAAYGFDPALDVVTAEFHRIQLRHALPWILSGPSLAWRQNGSAIEITTPQAVESDSTATLLDVADLVRREGVPVDEELFEHLVELVTSTIEPQTWFDWGGFGHVKRYRGKLLVLNTPATIDRVRTFLTALRHAKSVALSHAESAPPHSSFAIDQPAQPELDDALRQPIGIEIDKRPMRAALRELQEKHQLPLILDLLAIGQAELDLEAEVSVIGGEDITLNDALNQICRANDFVWTIHSGGLVVTADDTSLNEYGPYLETRLYPVVDLLGDHLPGDEFDEVRRDFDYDDLSELITAAIEATSWEDLGGPGTAQAEPDFGLLVVSQSRANHAAVERLLRKLRQEFAKHPRERLEPIERVRHPLRLVVYSFATPESERDRRTLAIQRAEAAVRAKRAASKTQTTSEEPATEPETRRGTLPESEADKSPELPRSQIESDLFKDDPLGDDPFAPPKAEHEPDRTEDDRSPFDAERIFDEATAEEEDPGPPETSDFPKSDPAAGPGDPLGDPFGEAPEPFGPLREIEPNPLGEIPLLETPDEADLRAYDPDVNRELPITEEALLAVITSVIEPATWARDERTVAQTAHRRIIIRHTDAVHRKIRELAERMRVKDFREADEWPGFGGFGGFGGGTF